MASLKAKIEGVVQNFIPTNVQLVLAIILKCDIAASHNSKPRTPIRPTVLFQMVNLHRRMLPKLPQNAMGNWFWPLPILFKEDETQLHELVSTMRKGLTDFVNEKANRFKAVEGFLVVFECIRERGQLLKSTKGINLYWATSLCKLPSYEMDFGWGKPTWDTSKGGYKNVIALLDTRFCDGIEAWVTLDEPEMAIFESDEELLAYWVPSTPAQTMFDIKSSIKLKSNM
ncbi:vinorine synthase-like [Prunus yedoensis var. nudiflora]|uniref:Vinorine synthase-like n=1 Tax=Prunus yedoensis var. nudiflora TaxID=2094558 RepID=A0A314ZKC9_PRUYE|nr:vinorine synthase-like [Prunus yedoensis var. nudiflora]